MAQPEKKQAVPPTEAEYTVGLGTEDLTDRSLESKKMDLESGLLGKIFGNEKTAPTNIAGFIGASATLTLVLVVCTKQATEIGEVLKFVTPIITGVLGFVFGKRK